MKYTLPDVVVRISQPGGKGDSTSSTRCDVCPSSGGTKPSASGVKDDGDGNPIAVVSVVFLSRGVSVSTCMRALVYRTIEKVSRGLGDVSPYEIGYWHSLTL